MCLNASFRKGSFCCLLVCQRFCHKLMTVSTSAKNSGSLSATHLLADRSSVFRPHETRRCVSVRSASSRAPSGVTTGTISLPASEKKRGKSASSMPRGIVRTHAEQRRRSTRSSNSVVKIASSAGSKSRQRLARDARRHRALQQAPPIPPVAKEQKRAN